MVNLSGKMRAKNSGDEVFFHITVGRDEYPLLDSEADVARAAVAALRTAMQEFHDLKNIEVSA